MKSPWTDTDEAYDAMYDERVVVKTKNGSTQTLSCCVMLDNTGDVLTDEMLDTDREDIILVTRKRDWKFVKSIQRGDTVRRPCTDKQYSVMSVNEDFTLGYIVKARQTSGK